MEINGKNYLFIREFVVKAYRRLLSRNINVPEKASEAAALKF